jgi:hypothetical protein
MPPRASASGRPNPAFNLTIQKLRFWGPSVLRAPVAG